MSGGIDKRVLARPRAEIDAYLERVLPRCAPGAATSRPPTTGVPEEVSYENYLYYRKRCAELGG